MVLLKDGGQVAEGKGAMAMGHPAKAVVWLAGKLADRGKYLRAGQFVMTGRLTPLLSLEKGATYVGMFSTLGEIIITFI